MKYHIMKRLKENYHNNKPIYGFDVETEQNQESNYIRQKFYMGSVAGADGFKRVFFDDKKFMEFLLSRKFMGSMIFATNLEFDFMHIFQNSQKFAKDMFFIRKNDLMYVKYNYDLRNRIEFLDTWNYSGKVSVDEMGKMLKIPKLKTPQCFKRKAETFEEKEELIRYNLRDSTITYLFAEKMRDFCNELGCKQKITIASIGLDNWRRNYQPIDMFQEKREYIKKQYLAFHGGRVEVYKRGLYKNVYFYDINSSYPFCCFNGIDGKGSYPLPSSVKYSQCLSEYDINNYDGISRVDVYCPKMYLPVLGITTAEGKYIFPVGNFTGWFTNIELRKALELGYEIKRFHEGLYYTQYFKPFRKCVNDLYNLRKKYKIEDNQIMQRLVKVLMNGGLFGKFGQKIDEKDMMISKDSLYCDEKGNPYVVQFKKQIFLNKFHMRGNFIFYKIKNPKRIPIFIFPILSSYTTAMARLNLYEFMENVTNNLLYADTDSIITQGESFKDSDRLGELKLEYIGKEAIFIKPKFYYILPEDDRAVFKTKGVGKYISDKNKFDEVLETREVMIERFTKIKESAVRKMPFSSIIEVQKHLSMEDNKRLWKNKFNARSGEDSTALVLG